MEEPLVAEPELEIEILAGVDSAKAWPLLKSVLVEELKVMPERTLKGLVDSHASAQARAADTTFLLRSGSVPAGCLVLSEGSTPQAETALITLWVVDASRRGRGAGRELLRHAIAAARQKGIRHIRARTLASHPGPVRLLWSLGFRVCGQDVFSGDTTRELLVFERPLRTAAEEREGGA